MCHLYPYNNVKLLRKFFYINYYYLRKGVYVMGAVCLSVCYSVVLSVILWAGLL